MNFPENLRYTKDHEWLSLDGTTATIGITDFAQRELGDIVYIDITAKGKSLGAEEVFGSVEAVKTVSDLFLPVAGTITEINPLLDSKPELVNSDPYGDGWMVKMTVNNVGDVEKLMNAQAYSASVAQNLPVMDNQNDIRQATTNTSTDTKAMHSGQTNDTSPVKKFVPGIAWFFLILILVCLPGSRIPTVDTWLNDIYFDKWVHTGLFAILTILFIYPVTKLSSTRILKKILPLKLPLLPVFGA